MQGECGSQAGKMQQFKLRGAIILIVFGGLMGYVLLSRNYVTRQICLKTGSFAWVSALYFAAICLICYRVIRGFPIRQVSGKISSIVYLIFTSVLAIYMEEKIWNRKLYHINKIFFLLNVLFTLLVTISFLVLIRKMCVAYCMVMVLSWLYGLVNHYVLEFKGCPPLFSDLIASETAITVMKKYDYLLSDEIVIGTLIFMLYLVLILYYPPSTTDLKLGNDVKLKKHLILKRVVILGIVWFGILNIDVTKIFGVTIDGWATVESFYKNGAPITMLASWQNVKISKPKGYSTERVDTILESYEVQKENLTEKPSVIVIMNESFSDLSILGNFECDDYLKNFNAMDSWTMRGNVYVSVCGGGTCNSEFEFLTGSSMANVKTGVYPYQNYNLVNSYNLVNVFDSLGYQTTAFHPYDPKNWNRINVYNDLGFQEFLSIDDMADTSSINGWTVSDESDYKKVKEIYENRTAPLFLFNVTMQNHGGYGVALGPDIDLISIEKQYKGFEDVINYLTLMRESDKAFANLIEYFSQKQEPVVVCMFGDHQPILDGDFISSFEEFYGDNPVSVKEKRFVTPYMIWSNYDLGIEQKEQDMSLNYLGANLLNILGIRTEYTGYLLDLQKEMPVINSVGYKDNNGEWHRLDEEIKKINEYQAVQYYELFER